MTFQLISKHKWMNSRYCISRRIKNTQVKLSWTISICLFTYGETCMCWHLFTNNRRAVYLLFVLVALSPWHCHIGSAPARNAEKHMILAVLLWVLRDKKTGMHLIEFPQSLHIQHFSVPEFHPSAVTWKLNVSLWRLKQIAIFKMI